MASKYVTSTGKERWRARLYADGREVATKGGFERKRDAEAWERANRGRKSTSTMTVSKWLDSGGRASVMAGLGAQTKRTYASHLDLRIVPDLGFRRLDSVKPGQIESLRSVWLNSGLSPSTVNGTLNALARIFRQAVKDGALAESPMSDVERARAAAPKTVPVIEIGDVVRLAKECDKVHPNYGDYVRVAAFTGCRAGEIAALCVEDVHLERGVITVARAYSAGVLQTTKSGRVRQVPVLDPLRPLLMKLTVGRGGKEPLLLGPRGGRINHWNVRDSLDWVRLVERMGWPGFRFHDLRATAIVSWIRAGVPLTTVREMAGHASLATTDKYARMARNDLSSAAAAINAFAAPYTEPYMEGGSEGGQ